MLGFAATQFLFCADTVFVNVYFGAERTAPYVAAGTSRGPCSGWCCP